MYNIYYKSVWKVSGWWIEMSFHCNKFPGLESSQEPDRPALHSYRLYGCSRDSGPYLIRKELRTYLNGQNNTYYIVFCAFHNGIIRLKNLHILSVPKPGYIQTNCDQAFLSINSF